MSSLVVVAIPAEDDYVHQVSSEKVSHMTLLYLGEAGTADEVPAIMDFVEHAAKRMAPFYMDVEFRGTLGEDDADVIFFEKTWDFDRVEEFRENLKGNPAIKAAYNSAEQFDGWLPHLTLGYPETPANKPDKDRPLSMVRFNRIAVWDGDFTGKEFRLKHPEAHDDIDVETENPTSPSLAMGVSEIGAAESVLAHYGKKGMKWGVVTSRGSGSEPSRRGPAGPAARTISNKGAATKTAARTSAKDGATKPKAKVAGVVAGAKPAERYKRQQAKREQQFKPQAVDHRVAIQKKGDRQIQTKGGRFREPHPEAVAARKLNAQRKASGLQSLSNQELRDLAQRLQLEQSVTKLTTSPQKPGIKAFLTTVLLNQKVRSAHARNYADIDAILGGGKLPGARKANQIK